MKKLINIPLILFLTACTEIPPQKTVFVPMPTKCPAPKLPPAHVYPVSQLKEGDSFSKVAKAYVVSLQMCMSENKQMRKLWEAYE